MSTSKRLSEVFHSAREIPFDDSSKFVFFSDCHRGDNSWADDFAHNQTLFFHALTRYNKEKFTYIELGDGDELWENRKFEDIKQAHSHVMWLLKEFHRDKRLYLIWGNHDKEKKNKKFLEDIEVHEGLVLRHSDTGDRVLLIHGHQGDLICDRLWRVGRFCVRHVWRHLQLIGIKDPTSPAKNFKKREETEKKLVEWVIANRHMLIAGHTHRSVFPEEGTAPYFNDGSCVHPRCITGIEIQNGEITLVKWWLKPNEEGVLYVAREKLEGPKKLQSYFQSN